MIYTDLFEAKTIGDYCILSVTDKNKLRHSLVPSGHLQIAITDIDDLIDLLETVRDVEYDRSIEEEE